MARPKGGKPLKRSARSAPSAAATRSRLIDGARHLPTHHVTIRVPWHDSGWSGGVCQRPSDNSSCLIFKRIGRSRDDATEIRCAGAEIDSLSETERPPCADERATFMSPRPLRRMIQHRYVALQQPTHLHFRPTEIVGPPFSAACTPFRWMLRKYALGEDLHGEQTGDGGYVERFRLGFQRNLEPPYDESGMTPFAEVRLRDGSRELAVAHGVRLGRGLPTLTLAAIACGVDRSSDLFDAVELVGEALEEIVVGALPA